MSQYLCSLSIKAGSQRWRFSHNCRRSYTLQSCHSHAGLVRFFVKDPYFLTIVECREETEKRLREEAEKVITMIQGILQAFMQSRQQNQLVSKALQCAFSWMKTGIHPRYCQPLQSPTKCNFPQNTIQCDIE